MAYEQLGIRPPIKESYLLPIKSFAKRLEEDTRRLLQIESKTKLQWLQTLIPIVGWLPNYPWRKHLPSDLMAGLAVGVMAVPQSFSYANLAALPGVFGLYGMVTPVIIYSLFGSSRQLGVGPVAVTSLLLGNGLNSMYGTNSNPNTPKNVELQNTLNHAAIEVCLLAGIFYTCIGAFRLGWIANFLSHSVVSGFMSGSSILIGLTQVKYILGIKIPRADTVPDNLSLIHGAINGFKWQEFLMGSCWIITLMIFRAVGTRYAKLTLLKSLGPVFITVIALIIMYSTSWTTIATVGKIPSGLPLPTFSWWQILDHGSSKFTLAILICAVDLCESLSIARALAQKNRQEISQRQEIIALGLANLSGAMFNCYTTTGSFSRSAVNQSVGAKSQLAGLVTGFFMLFVLLVLTPTLSKLPSNIQGAVVIVGVAPLFDFSEWWFLWKSSLLDWVVWNVAFFFTMMLGVETGIAVSVGLSLALIVFQVSFPHVVTLGKIADSRVYRSTDLYASAVPEPGILALRVDAPIVFANFAQIRQFIRDRIIANKDAIEEATAAGASVPLRIHSVILDLSAVPYIDASAIHLLHDLFNELKAGGRRGGPVQMLFANPAGDVIKQLSLGTFFSEHGTEEFFIDIYEAVEWAKANQLPSRISEPHAPSLAFRAMGVNNEAKAIETA